MRRSIILTRTECTVLPIFFLVCKEGNLVNSASSVDGLLVTCSLSWKRKSTKLPFWLPVMLLVVPSFHSKLDVFNQWSVGPITSTGIAASISPYFDLSDGVLLFGEREFGTAGTSRAFVLTAALVDLAISDYP
jgi:hypothetical protein